MSKRSRDPAASLPSPPPSKSPFHEFFTPRRPLKNISTSESNSRSQQLMSPEDSPSNRTKRNRVAQVLYGADQKPIFLKGLDKQSEDEETRQEPEQQIVLKEPPKRIRPTKDFRLLMRSMGMYGSHRGGFGTFHCTDWSSEVSGIYSRPQDILLMNKHEEGGSQSLTLPFTVKACNTNSLVAVGDETGVVRLIDSGKDEIPGFSVPYFGIMCHDNAIFDISWSPDDHELVTASGDQTVRITDVMTKKTTAVLVGHRSTVKQVAHNPFAPAILTSCSRDGNIHIWDTRCVGVRADDGTIAQKPVNSLLAAHAERLATVKNRGQNNRTDVSVTAVVWTGEHQIASASEGNAVVKLWDIRACHSKRKTALAAETSNVPAHHSKPRHRPFGLNTLTLSPDGARIYSLCKDSVVYVYATRNLSVGPIHAYTHPRLHASTFYVKSSISRDGTLLATGSSDGVALVFPTDERYLDKKVYKPHPEESKAAMIEEEMKVGRGAALVRGHEKEVTDVSWTKDGDLVSISDDYHARCWRIGRDGEAEDMRERGEEEGRRWGWGWSEVE